MGAVKILQPVNCLILDFLKNETTVAFDKAHNESSAVKTELDSHKNETMVAMEKTTECLKKVREDISSMRVKVWYFDQETNMT